MAVDTAGNLFIADKGTAVIRKVDKIGNITTVAGNGSGGYNGDNGPAISTQLGSLIKFALTLLETCSLQTRDFQLFGRSTQAVLSSLLLGIVLVDMQGIMDWQLVHS